MKCGIDGLQKLLRLQNKVIERSKYISDLNGSKQTAGSIGLAPGPILHQDGESMTGEESALFERDNPEVMMFLQYLKNKLNSILREAS